MVNVTLTDEQAAKLFSLLDENKQDNEDIHEVLYQAMFKALFKRIDGEL